MLLKVSGLRGCLFICFDLVIVCINMLTYLSCRETILKKYIKKSSQNLKDYFFCDSSGTRQGRDVESNGDMFVPILAANRDDKNMQYQSES